MTSTSLSLVTPPATEPVSLAEAKAWLRIDTSDDNTLLASLITAARQSAEEYLRRSIMPQTWRLTIDLPCGSRDTFYDGVYDLPVTAIYGTLPRSVPLPRGPVSSVTSITTYGTTTNAASIYDAADYRVDASGDRLTLNSGAVWPSDVRARAGTEIVYVAGYSSVPQPIKTGILIHIASLYEQRGMCDDDMGLPPGTRLLYGPYRIMGDRRG